jgi:hypothetical protein
LRKSETCFSYRAKCFDSCFNVCLACVAKFDLLLADT